MLSESMVEELSTGISRQGSKMQESNAISYTSFRDEAKSGSLFHDPKGNGHSKSIRIATGTQLESLAASLDDSRSPSWAPFAWSKSGIKTLPTEKTVP